MMAASQVSTVTSSHLSFGILTDVQYADLDDGEHFSRTRKRYYRNSLNLVKAAIDDWKTMETHPVAFVLQLGDLIDGQNKKGGDAVVKNALNSVLQLFDSITFPIYHLIGNHELYNMNRTSLLQSVLNSSINCRIEDPDAFYFTFAAHPKLRILALDTYELGVLGYEDKPDDDNFMTAQSMLHQRNQNSNTSDITGLEGFEQRWASYNGGISDKQMLWLSQMLERAQSNEENVIIISHVPLRCSLRDVCLAWNYKEILATINKFRCVITVFSGHDHPGWDILDEDGIQHIIFQSILETPPGDNAYATAQLWDKTLTVTGVGKVPSFTIPLRFPVC